MSGIRSEARKGAGWLSSSFSPPTVTGKHSMYYFPEETIISSILDEAGVDVKATYLKGSNTVAANTTIAVNGDEEGNFFTGITISSGSVNYVNA